MRELGKILLVILIIGLLGCGLVLAVLSLAFSDKKEIVELYNKTANEKIYLIETSWGMDDSRMAIGLDKELKGGFGNLYPDKYQYNGMWFQYILYKFQSDTLHIYGNDFISPEQNHFRTPIILHDLTDSEKRRIEHNYKERGISIFPESKAYIIENKTMAAPNKPQ
ncbi:hypothetical protein [Carboxylicivirga marina]|uniref:Uncharacterized protein n=1 Tax=Carboxylicivirga marina TaxID=2800988 RepID=A0ABS1HI45_9BACT|nr:hypothetical protein [Carboxylicivirga marina]MBK3517332.1 hypothetical protein [Carboxylicivirga marina]